jgi:hypothetical protein
MNVCERSDWNFLVCMAIISTLVGCDQKGLVIYPAGGKVTYKDGQPVIGVWVMFRSTDGERPITSRGATAKDGTFKLTTVESDDGAVAGKHKVLLVVPAIENEGPVLKGDRAIPSHYSTYETSGLEFTVTEDLAKNQFEIVITR